MTDPTRRCPASTGLPTFTKRCPITDAEHRCAGQRGTHIIHVCKCGNEWVSQTADRAVPARTGDPQ